MMWLLLLSPLSWGVDPDSTVYVVGKYANGEGVIRAYDLSDGSVTDVDAFEIYATSATEGYVGVALDPIEGMLYVCEQGNQIVTAFWAETVSRSKFWSITLDSSTTCGALEIDPFRRILYVGGIAAYSLNGALDEGNYGELLSSSNGSASGVACAEGSDGNQLVRDPINNVLYCYDTEGGSATTYVYAWTTSGHVPASGRFSWSMPSIMKESSIPLSGTSNGAVALDYDNLRLYQSLASSATREVAIDSFTSAVNNGNATTRTTSAPADTHGLHFITHPVFYSPMVLLETSGVNVCFYKWSQWSISGEISCDTHWNSPTTQVAAGVEYYPYDEAEGDDDGDGLPDSVEVGAQPGGSWVTPITFAQLWDSDPTTTTDPDDADTDDDGLTDGEEDANFNGAVGSRETDPNNDDTDDDSLLDGYEVRIGTNPLNADSDGDSLSDGEEVLGTQNVAYERAPTNPSIKDTDSDGLDDGVEVLLGTDPNNDDTDEDGLADLEEGELGTDPRNPDTDNDGIDDGTEVVEGTDPLEADQKGGPSSCAHHQPPASGMAMMWLLAALAVMRRDGGLPPGKRQPKADVIHPLIKGA